MGENFRLLFATNLNLRKQILYGDFLVDMAFWIHTNDRLGRQPRPHMWAGFDIINSDPKVSMVSSYIFEISFE